MNIAVGTISNGARAAILAAGGRIEATLKENVVMAILPEGAEIVSSNNDGSLIHLDAAYSLYFKRAWHTEDCVLKLLGE